MIHLFQVGDVPLHLHQQTWHGYELVGKAENVQLLRSSTYLWSGSPYAPAPVEVQIESVLLHDGVFTPSQRLQQLRALIDFPVPLIGYVADESCNQEICACQFTRNCILIWLSTYGVVKQVEAAQDAANAPMTVTITLEFAPHWEPLNRYLWAWQSSPFNYINPPPDVTDYASVIHLYPDCTVFAQLRRGMHWTKRPVSDETILYDPVLWAALAHDRNPGYPQFSHQSDFIAMADADHSVYMDTRYWGAHPRSIYAIRNITTAVRFTITVTRQDGPHNVVEEVTEINVGAADISILYIGDLYRKPGFYIPSPPTSIVDDVLFSTATYPGLFPGMLGVGMNRVQFEVIDNGFTTAPEVAWQHLYRRF